MKKLRINLKVLFYTSALIALTMGFVLSSCSKDDSGTGTEQSEIQKLKEDMSKLSGQIDDLKKDLQAKGTEKDPQEKGSEKEKGGYADKIKDIYDRLERLEARLQQYSEKAGGSKDEELQRLKEEIKELKGTVSQISEKLGVKQKSSGEKVNLVEIPDIEFRAYLMAIIPDAFPDGGDKMDTNSEVVKNLRRIELAEMMNIESVKGIEYFTALTYLNITTAADKELDVSHNTALVYLSCKVQSTTLDLSKNKALAFLHLYDTKLTSLDLSENKALVYLNCEYNNQLKSLNLEHNTALTELHCSYNANLTSLNLEHNTALTDLNCSSNQLMSLNLGHNALTRLDCSYNKLMSLNLRT